jgi:tetratricopeptide (TPR) repeat protein
MNTYNNRTGRNFAAALALGITAFCLTALSAATTSDKAVRDAYDKWLLSLDSTGSPKPGSSALLREYAGCAARLEAELEQVSPAGSAAGSRKVEDQISSLKKELRKPARNDSRQAAIELALEGNWPQAGEEIARIPEPEHTVLDDVIAGYGALSRKDWLASSEIFRRVDENPWKSALLLDASAIEAENPGNPQAVLLRCDALLRVRLPASCATYASRREEALSKSPLGFLVKDLALIGMGDLHAAKTLAVSHFAQAPNDFYAPYLLGTINLLQQDITPAGTNFGRALHLEKDFFPAQNGLGVAFLLQGNDAKAVECFNAALAGNRSAYVPAVLNKACAVSGRAALLVARTRQEGGKGLLGGGSFTIRSMFDMTDIQLANVIKSMTPAQTASCLQQVKQFQIHSEQSAGVFGWMSLPNISVRGTGISMNGSVLAGNSLYDSGRWSIIANNLANHLNSFPTAAASQYKGAIMKAGGATLDVGSTSAASPLPLGASSADGWTLDLVLMVPTPVK